MPSRQFPQLAALKIAARSLLELQPTDSNYSARRRRLEIVTKEASEWLMKQLFPEEADKCSGCEKLQKDVDELSEAFHTAHNQREI